MDLNWTRFLIAAVTILISSCQLMNRGDAPTSEPISPDDLAQANGESLEKIPTELKQAKIWARLDEIEQEQSRQKARIKLLEQGLLLGVIPDELRDPSDLEHEKQTKKKAQKQLDTDKDSKPAAEAKPSNASPVALAPAAIEKSNDRTAFEKEISAAQDIFREGRYGKAVVAFEELGGKYNDDVTGGTHHYWIALSWFNLKEYETAQKHFQILLSKHSSSPWIPRSKLYLARIQVRRGLREQALDSLQKIISEYGNEDAADMARADIESLKRNL